jgi:hypothetical protein
MTKIISIDSKLRDQGTSSDFSIVTQMPFNNNYNRCSILEAEIPKTYYTISDSDAATIQVVEVAGLTFTIVMDKGRNYNASQFATVLETELDGSASTRDYTVTFNNTTGKFVISSNVGEFSFDPLTPQMKKYTGFPAAVTSASGIVISTNVVNIQKTDVVYIRCTFARNDNDNTLLTMYPNGVPDFSVIKYDSSDPAASSATLTNNQNGRLEFDLQDENNQNIDLNGVDCRFKLLLYTE